MKKRLARKILKYNEITSPLERTRYKMRQLETAHYKIYKEAFFTWHTVSNEIKEP